MRITPLASGSAGNSFLLQANGSALLIDAGLSGKELIRRMERVGMDPGALSGILVSHGHSDHVKGVGVLSRKYKIPIWMNRGTRSVASRAIGKPHSLELFETGTVFQAAGFRVHPFSVPHDCEDPVGFRISKDSKAVGIATDLGTATNLVLGLLTGTQALVLESNHDPTMLRDGPYPWDLKQRIRGRRGHLSNQESARLLQRLLSDNLKAVILAHMSETNNTSELALECARQALRPFLEHGGSLSCATQNDAGDTIEL